MKRVLSSADRKADQEIGRILTHYRFGEEDARKLQRLRPLFDEKIESLLPGFYSFIFSFEHARTFLGSAEVLQRHETGIRRWFLALVEGRYDAEYFRWLSGISRIHVHIGLPTHYVNAAFSYVREALGRLLLEEEQTESLDALNKILDINLDILTLTYTEQEHQQLLGEVVLLRQAAVRGAVRVYVQPIVSARDGTIKSYECLMRLEDEHGELHSIGPLLKTAKRIHLYRGLMEMMVDRSLQAFEALPYNFSLNLSYDDLEDPSFIRFLYDRLEAFPRPERIIFEILETDMIGDFTVVERFIARIREWGCSIAVDDFGSGYSNLENVLELHPDYIKIDGSIIERIIREVESKTLVKNVIEMARDFEAAIVAEYVSSREIYESVVEAGVDYLQGYYLAKPFAVERLTEEGAQP